MTASSAPAICPGMQPFIRNQWYVIAFSNEVAKGKLLHRKCMGEPLVIFRAEDGAVSALYDRCPHRGVPLSKGRIVDDKIQCPYHGMQFDGSGACAKIPTQDKIPAAARTRSYPVAERMQFVWVWMGKPANADHTLLPDYADAYCDGPGWQYANYFMMEIKANYSLLFENLLDTSHISFLHVGGIDGGLMANAPYTVEAQGAVVTLERNLSRDEAVGGTAKLFSMVTGTVFSRKLTSRSLLPHLHIIRNEIGFPDEPGRKSNVRINIMPITPATSNSLYQFVTIATSYPVEVTRELKDQLWTVFSQDSEALEAIQAGYDEFGPDLREVSVKADAAALAARRTIARIGKLEGAQAE
jgi:phenylpropionate dioxygenase-like ring-hydroxylating dioxygenase large terminal subunit